MKFSKIWSSIMWIWKNRRNISSIKTEALQAKDAIAKARKDDSEGGKRVTKNEMRKILVESDDILDIFIDLLGGREENE